ncbi:DUF998 domain-containing protein [Rahnella sp. AA]|uniref:DUF998 domain-containing protein n=1 Tax=Rahnella sp. AA TaxID=2057180 RepID=UPI000C324639|nr:DUF998 domain-containing protein [Rahnella sp. AA]PKE30898.1 DUF998 domain-containing protein [Rahnella sp. AA]
MQTNVNWQKKGALCFTVGGILYLLAEKISSTGWRDPSYSYLHNYISDLGIASCGMTPDGRDICSPLHNVMNAGFAAEGILFFMACWLLRPIFPGAGRQVFILSGLLHAIGGVLIALFHSGGSTGGVTVHQAGAVMAIAGGNVCLLSAGWMKFRSAGWRVFSLFSLALSGIGLVSMVTISFDILPTGLIERMSVYPITFWQIFTGFWILSFRTENA